MNTVAQTIQGWIKQGLSNAEVLDQVRTVHPRAKVSIPTINLYRNALRKKDKKIPSDRQARRR